MDKPRHPQVIQPWKTRQTQKLKSNAFPATNLRRTPGQKPVPRKHG